MGLFVSELGQENMSRLTSSTGPADQSGLTSDQGSWRIDLELLSKSDGGERNGNESFSEHDCLVVNEKGW